MVPVYARSAAHPLRIAAADGRCGDEAQPSRGGGDPQRTRASSDCDSRETKCSGTRVLAKPAEQRIRTPLARNCCCRHPHFGSEQGMRPRFHVLRSWNSFFGSALACLAALFGAVIFPAVHNAGLDPNRLFFPDVGSIPADLTPPQMTSGAPAPGRRVKQISPEYLGT